MVQQGLSYPPGSIPPGYSLLKRQILETIIQIINESLVEYILQGESVRLQENRKGKGQCLIHNRPISAQNKVKYIQ